MRLSILVAALEERNWRKLQTELLRQAEPFADVEVLVEVDNRERTSGQKRQFLASSALGEYRCFVDDDDRVEPDYVASIRELATGEPDVICFNLSHSFRKIWRFGLWPNRGEEGKMRANHLCVWHRRWADRVGWCPLLGYGDDQVWFETLFALAGSLGRELKGARIDRVLYHYDFSPAVTVNQGPGKHEEAAALFGGEIKTWTDGVSAWVEMGELAYGPSGVPARLPKGLKRFQTKGIR